jgi:hypothetical protein
VLFEGNAQWAICNRQYAVGNTQWATRSGSSAELVNRQEVEVEVDAQLISPGRLFLPILGLSVFSLSAETRASTAFQLLAPELKIR